MMFMAMQLLPVAVLLSFELCCCAASHSGGGGPLCILPLGDSLTQGVGLHGSYRHYLDQLVRELFPQVEFTFTGSMQYTCTKRNPAVEFKVAGSTNTTRSLRHEGHCGWNSASVLRALPQLASSFHCRPDVVLLLVGTNDIFQVAKVCHIDEWSKMHPTVCPENHMSHYTSNLRRIVDWFRVQYQSKFIVALSPPSGFPMLDGIVHRIVAEVASRESASIFGVVEFVGWKVGVHTFDTTHPAQAGCELMARSWMEILSPFITRWFRKNQQEKSVETMRVHVKTSNKPLSTVHTVDGSSPETANDDPLEELMFFILFSLAVLGLLGLWRRKRILRC